MNVNELRGYCNGCSACAVVCPKQAISIIKNDRGFFESVVDTNKCINCGICNKVCKKNQKDINNPKVIAAMALQSKDINVVKESSSGGVAFEISRYFLEKKYGVVGSFFDLNKNSVVSKLDLNQKDLELFKKSKYLQSNFYEGLKDAVSFARKDKNSKFVVFGTPCQINAAANVCDFYNIANQFILVDFFCHGVPSYKVWEYYLLDNKINNSTLKNVVFRTKDKGWHSCFKMHVQDANKTISKRSSNDDFYNAFFDNVFFMKSCYSCDFRKGFSKADIRLGDYWGKRYIKNNDGVSAAFVYSKKGIQLLKDVNIRVLENADVSDVLKAQSTKDYSEETLNDFALNILADQKSLKRTIKIYRKKFNFKRRVKLGFKRIIGTIFPSSFINFLKRF